MDIPVVIPCYFQNDESRQILNMEDELGIQMDVDIDEIFDVQDVYFFDVAYIFRHPNGKDTMIGSGVEDFRTPLKIKDVLKRFK